MSNRLRDVFTVKRTPIVDPKISTLTFYRDYIMCIIRRRNLLKEVVRGAVVVGARVVVGTCVVVVTPYDPEFPAVAEALPEPGYAEIY